MFVYGEVKDEILRDHILANATNIVSTHKVPAAEACAPIIKATPPEKCSLSVVHFMVCVAKVQKMGKHVQQCCQFLSSVSMINVPLSRSAR
jgi:hypothetical protein